MPDSSLYILTGPVRSGKTSALLKWIRERKEVSGILTPVVNGKRIFLDITSGESFSMEAALKETEILEVGRFVFSSRNFQIASERLHTAVDKPGWLIIDEIGPLELKGEGFHPVLTDIFSRRMNHMILVVREGLVQQVTESYSLVSPRFVSPEMLMDIT